MEDESLIHHLLGRAQQVHMGEPGGPMSLWDVIPLRLKAKNQRRLEELQGVQVGGILGGIPSTYDVNDWDEERVLYEVEVARDLSGGMNEKWFRGSLGPLFATLRADEHDLGLESVARLNRELRAGAFMRQEQGMPETDSSRRWRDELEGIRSTIIHHRDHGPGPWMQGYVYPESTGVPTGY
jgi:hypothetical protein